MRRSLPVLGAFALFTAACRATDAAPERHVFVDSRDWYDPRSLDPAHATDVPSGRAVAYLFDGLTRFAPDGALEPALARAWETSSDGRTYTFHLRSGVTFHDGTPFIAADVARSFRRLLDPATKAGTTWPLLPIAGARAFAAGTGTTLGVTTPDDSTVVITLEEPLAIFPKLLAMPAASIVPARIGDDFRERPVGTGPWKLAEWRHDDHLTFVRNPAYFDGAPTIDTLRARIIPEPSTAVAEFESGTVDLLYVPEDQARAWENTDERKAQLLSAPALRLWYVGMNTTRGPLTDVRVRQAIAHAIDVPTILTQLLAGRGRVTAGIIPPTLDGADTTRAPYAYDTTAARRLLADAGHANGIDLELWSSQTQPWPRLAQTLQAYLGAVGIRVKLVQRDAAASRAAARAGQVDLIVKDWYADYPDAENFLYPLLHGANAGAGGNVSFFKDAAYDKLVSAARRESDDAKRTTLYRSADSLAYRQMPLLPLWFYNEVYAVQPWVQGFTAPAIFNGQRFVKVRLGK
ncbi:MAG: ABC transporter substrate-binding protein [Gemmatimonadetes bacterium]|nr:ABC transporter substrate-binding protein [Gemmatimonadota bacterium]